MCSDYMSYGRKLYQKPKVNQISKILVLSLESGYLPFGSLVRSKVVFIADTRIGKQSRQDISQYRLTLPRQQSGTLISFLVLRSLHSPEKPKPSDLF